MLWSEPQCQPRVLRRATPSAVENLSLCTHPLMAVGSGTDGAALCALAPHELHRHPPVPRLGTHSHPWWGSALWRRAEGKLQATPCPPPSTAAPRPHGLCSGPTEGNAALGMAGPIPPWGPSSLNAMHSLTGCPLRGATGDASQWAERRSPAVHVHFGARSLQRGPYLSSQATADDLASGRG